MFVKEVSFSPYMKFHTSLSSILVNMDGYFLEQHSPMQPCKTPRATLLMLSKRGAPDENNVSHFFTLFS